MCIKREKNEKSISLCLHAPRLINLLWNCVLTKNALHVVIGEVMDMGCDKIVSRNKVAIDSRIILKCAKSYYQPRCIHSFQSCGLLNFLIISYEFLLNFTVNSTRRL